MATQTVSHAVLAFPQQAPADQISQSELSEFLAARKTLAKLTKHVADLESAMLARLQAGARVEDGPHTASAKRSTRRYPAWKEIVKRLAGRLDMDGDAYCSNVIAHTKPTESFSIDIN